jgi:hypothetical protein
MQQREVMSTEKKQIDTTKSKKKKPNAEELFKDWKPEVVEYDPDVDGSEEHMVREKLLSEKERLKEVITKLKEKNRGDRKVRR